jgi:outer membrane protein OmpA-like peptidoglycan-associated protein
MHPAYLLSCPFFLFAHLATPASAADIRAASHSAARAVGVEALVPSGTIESPAAAIVPEAVEVVAAAYTVSDFLERAREIRFESGTTKLTDGALAFLNDLAAALAKDPIVKLEILVHTAGSGDAQKDLSVSKRRAEVIKRVLVDKGVGADQLLATGRGSESPIAPNLTRTGRMRNERVELHRVSVPGHK